MKIFGLDLMGVLNFCEFGFSQLLVISGDFVRKFDREFWCLKALICIGHIIMVVVGAKLVNFGINWWSCRWHENIF